MAIREIKIGCGTYLRADSNPESPVWGFGLMGEKVDVADSDLERFDRLNGPAAAPEVPLPEVVAEVEGSVEPPRSGKGSGLDAWLDYAIELGLDVPEDATRDDVIALVDDRK